MVSKIRPWYWLTVVTAITAALATLVTPDNLIAANAKSVLDLVFLFFLPGFVIVKAIFPNKSLAPKPEVDLIERLFLSVGVSLAIVPMLGLILNYLPWRLYQEPVAIGILCLILLVATIGVTRENRLERR